DSLPPIIMRKHLSVLILCTLWILIVSAAADAQGPAVGSNSAAAVLTQSSVPQATQQSPLEKAEQLYRTGKFAAAAQEYDAVLQAEPKSALAYVGLVHVYLRQKKSTEAYAAAAKAIELAPSLQAAHVALGEAYFRQGKLSDAEKEFANLVNTNTR